jgi:hypothetical protein
MKTLPKIMYEYCIYDYAFEMKIKKKKRGLGLKFNPQTQKN